MLPQFDMDNVPVTNFDQFTLLPVVCAVWVVLISLLLKYADFRARTKLLVMKDEIELNELWEGVKVTSYEALVDVKREMDKLSFRIQQLQELQQNSDRTSTRRAVYQRVGLKINDDDAASTRSENGGGRSDKMVCRAPWLALSRMCNFQDIGEPSLEITRKDDEHSWDRITSIGQLYTVAAGVELLLREKVQFWAEFCQGCFPATTPGFFVAWKDARNDVRLREQIIWTELKGRSRCFEKCLRCYRGDVSSLLDVARETLVFERFEEMSQCLALIRQDTEVEVVRTKNRMDPDWDEHPIYAAYRDVALNLRFCSEEASALGLDGHICELRLSLMSISSLYQGDAGKERHARYVQVRNAKTF